MGLIDRLLATNDATATLRALADALNAEIPATAKQGGRYDRMVDAVNRLPRPVMALGALILLAYAMLDPAGFSQRMTALANMPEALWWLVGGVITFTFGARETHYLRNRPANAPETAKNDPNAALEDWQKTQP